MRVSFRKQGTAMQRLSAWIVFAAALAGAHPAFPESTECPNHYILRECVPCPRGVEVGPSAAVVVQEDKTFALVTVTRDVTSGPTPRRLTSLAVTRLNPPTDDGIASLDTTWADCGISETPIWGADDTPRAIVLQPDGKLLVLGTAPDPTEYLIVDYMLEPHYYVGVIRLNADGTIDRGFAEQGRRVLRVGWQDYSTEYDSNSRASALKLFADGRILVSCCRGYGYASVATVPVEQLRPDGSIMAVYATAPSQEGIAFRLDAMLEFVNENGELFATSDPDLAVMLDRSGAWFRTGRAFGTPELEWPRSSR